VGADAGFDFVPALSDSEVDRYLWDAFLREVETTYKNDPVLELRDKWLVFARGEHPRLPRQPQAFRRFSAKVTGRLCGNIMTYLRGVRDIASQHFGERVVWWNELVDEYGHYDWDEVHSAAEAYDPQKVSADYLIKRSSLSSLRVEAVLVYHIFSSSCVPVRIRVTYDIVHVSAIISYQHQGYFAAFLGSLLFVRPSVTFIRRRLPQHSVSLTTTGHQYSETSLM
jgi:hypothetical protein